MAGRRRVRTIPTGRENSVSRSRLAVTIVALLAFFLQSYLVQTHIHIWRSAGPHGGEIIVFDSLGGFMVPDNPPKGHGKHPVDDQDHCPFCQAMAVSGSFSSPPLILLPLPAALRAYALRIVPLAVQTRFPSYNWQGRAPPAV